MSQQKASYNFGRRGELEQRFIRPNVDVAFTTLPAEKRHHQEAHSVLIHEIDAFFMGFHHIERIGPPYINPVPHLNPHLSDHPPRIQAYTGETLHVIYNENNNQPSVQSTSEQEGDDENPPPGGGGTDNAGDDPHNNPARRYHDVDDDHGDDDMGDGMADYSNPYQLNASLSILPLTSPSIYSAKPDLSRTSHFLAVPMLGENGNVVPAEQNSWKVFKVCVCDQNKPATEGWTPHLIHERSYGVIGQKRAPRFIELFGPLLLSKAKWFLAALRKGNSPNNVPSAPMSDYTRVTSHLCRELHLTSNDQVEGHLEQTIKYLEDRTAALRPSSTGTFSEEHHATRSVLLSHLDQEDSSAMEEPQDGDPGAYPTADGKLVCFHHYKHLHPGALRYHAADQTNAISFDIYTGKLTATIKSEAELADLCTIDSDQIGFVSEADITMDWQAPMEEILRLHEFAARIGLNDVTICGGHTQEVPASPEHVETETSHVRDLLGKIAATMTRITVIWASKLDVAGLIKGMSETRPARLLYLAIQDSHREVSSVMCDSHLGVSRIKSTLGDLPSLSGESFLAGRAQSLVLSSDANWREMKNDIVQKLQPTIQQSDALTTLTTECEATGYAFKMMVKTIDGIVRPLNTGPGPRLKFRSLILKNNTDNDVAALFDLSQSSRELSGAALALDVTARSTTSLSSIITNFGVSIRVLHIIGDSPGCPNVIEELFDSETEPDKLVSLTLLLDQAKGTNVDALVKLQKSSKKTFKQLALVAQPLYEEAAEKILHFLGEIDKSVQVIVTRTQTAGVEDWIQRVQGAMEKSKESTLIVVKSAEELVRIVPSFTEAGLESLKTIFARPEMPTPMTGVQLTKMSASAPKQERP